MANMFASLGRPEKKKKKQIIPVLPKVAGATPPIDPVVKADPIVEPEIKVEPTVAVAPTPKETVTATVTPTVEKLSSTPEITQQTGPTAEELNAQLIATSKKKAIDALNAQFAKSSGRLDQEEGAIAGDFRAKESDIRTRDTLSRAGKGKFLDIGGLGQAGQVGQTALGQNVITQGALGRLGQQEIDLRADIERRRSELVAAREQGIADINTQIEIQQIESQLRSAEAQAQYEQEQATLKESREYDDYLRRVELADDREIALFEQQLLERNKEIDFAIDEARAGNDLVREAELTKMKAANDLQLEGIKQSGRLQLENRRSANTLSEIGARNQAAQQQILLRDQLGGQAQAEEEQLGGLPVKTIENAISNEIERNVQTAIDSQSLSERESGVNPISVEDRKQLALETIVQNADWFGNDANKLASILATYGISKFELSEYEDFVERALEDKPFE
jgi:hypothetical protein